MQRGSHSTAKHGRCVGSVAPTFLSVRTFLHDIDGSAFCSACLELTDGDPSGTRLG